MIVMLCLSELVYLGQAHKEFGIVTKAPATHNQTRITEKYHIYLYEQIGFKNV